MWGLNISSFSRLSCLFLPVYLFRFYCVSDIIELFIYSYMCIFSWISIHIYIIWQLHLRNRTENVKVFFVYYFMNHSKTDTHILCIATAFLRYGLFIHDIRDITNMIYNRVIQWVNHTNGHFSKHEIQHPFKLSLYNRILFTWAFTYCEQISM